jgi:hypothetical protein
MANRLEVPKILYGTSEMYAAETQSSDEGQGGRTYTCTYPIRVKYLTS